jgi:predicted DsbA family dithiol-disulfide isomerase
MNGQPIAELWEWAEYYCPWCYVAAVRLHALQKEYEGRVLAITRFFPIELLNGEEPPRDILEQEWWLASIQEPAATFIPYTADWPTTTLPAFDAVWAARQQGWPVAMEMDLRVRRAFFGESRNIGRRDVLLEIAREMEHGTENGAALDFSRFERDFASPAARAAVIEEGALGRERYHVRGTPTLMLADGTRVRPPIAMPRIRNRRIVSMPPLTCFGDGCKDATRALFDAALAQAQDQAQAPGGTSAGSAVDAPVETPAEKRVDTAAGDAGRGRDIVQESSMDSFPASDTPSWTPLRLGSP